MTSMRTKGKSTIVWLLMGMLLLGLGGFGVTNFAGGGAGELGEVGNTPVETSDYLRAINQEMRTFEAQTGQNLTAEQARQLGLPQVVQARLFAAAALEDEANRLGVSVGDHVVAEQIRNADAFHGLTGQFDADRYNQVLRSQGLTPASFEHDVRMDQARLILQSAVTDGVRAPQVVAERTAGWLLETRDLAWQELTDADLAAPITPPDEATLRAWHEANGARFTAPETRQITYAWLTPEMLADTVQLDDQALRGIYEQNIAEYQQPERRMVERLVYPDEAEAQAARARLDAGQATFEQLANERGLQLTDIDLGEVAEADLGAAGAAVFALDQPGVVGPVQTDLGPALLSMNAILDPVNITFEQALPDLRAEAAADAARRQIDDNTAGYEDLLAGGAELEALAEETPMEIGKIDWTAGAEQEHGSIAAYPEFRQRAATITQSDFPELVPLEDGGIFAMRLDNVVAPALIPFEDAREEVLADWTAAERLRRLQAVADERKLATMAPSTAPVPAAPAAPQPGTQPGTPPGTQPAAQAVATGPGAAAPTAPASSAPGQPAPGQPAPGQPAAPAPVAAPQLTAATNVTRDTVLDGAEPELVVAAFELTRPGEAEVVTANDRVFLVRLDGINPADLMAEDAKATTEAVSRRLTDSLQGDLFDYYTRALQAARGVQINAAAIAAANTQIQ